MHDKKQNPTANAKYVADWQELAKLLATHRQKGRRIIFTNGCFDILHSGHVTYLTQAKTQGDILVVGLNSDASVARLKGPQRPVNTLKDRAHILAALQAVDFVTPFHEQTPLRLIRLVRPNIYIKGGDYSRASLPETSVVERLGGKVIIMPLVSKQSTSNLIRRIKKLDTTIAGSQDHAESRVERLN